MEEAAIPRLARRFATVTWVMAAALAAAMAGTIAWAAAGPDFPEAAILYALFWLPTLFYLAGLIAIARAFQAVAAGEIFASSLSRGFRRAGWAIGVGGIVNLVVISVLHGAELPRGFASGATQLFTGISFDPAYVVMLLLGTALILVARLLDAGISERRRAERLQSELGEFL